MASVSEQLHEWLKQHGPDMRKKHDVFPTKYEPARKVLKGLFDPENNSRAKPLTHEPS